MPLTPGNKPVGSCWVYKAKYKSNGSIKHYKAHLVAQEYTQIEGLYYIKTFTSVTKLTTIRCLLDVTAAKNLGITPIRCESCIASWWIA